MTKEQKDMRNAIEAAVKETIEKLGYDALRKTSWFSQGRIDHITR